MITHKTEWPVEQQPEQDMLDWIMDVEVAWHQARSTLNAARSATDIDAPTRPGTAFPLPREEVTLAEAKVQALWDQRQDLNELHYGWRMTADAA